MRFSYAQVLVFGSAFFFLFCLTSLWIATKVVGIWYNPREDYFNTKKKVISLALAVDSLEGEVHQKEVFIGQLKTVIEKGEVLETPVGAPRQDTGKSVISGHVDLDNTTEADSILRSEFESGKSLHNITKISTEYGLQEEVLLPPVIGIVTENYDERKSHYGVDIVAKKDEPVKAVAEGVVIFASWTDDTGYVMGIQHTHNLVSFYKHNAFLHKKVGDAVKTGEIIATIGNTGELTTGPHLHFELWHNGSPINPKELIYF